MKGGAELDATLAELAAFGIVNPDVEQTRKHIKVRFDYQGEPKLIVVASSSSDWRAPENCRKTVRQVLGVKRVVKKSTKPKRQRNDTKADALPETITIREDPFALLLLESSCSMEFGRFGMQVAASLRRIRKRTDQAVQHILGAV